MKGYQVARVFCLAVVVFGCAKPKPAIVGRWQKENGNSVEFRGDGTMTMFIAERTREAKYRLVDDKTLELFTADGKPAGHWAISSLTSDTMVAAVQGSGAEDTFRRVK